MLAQNKTYMINSIVNKILFNTHDTKLRHSPTYTGTHVLIAQCDLAHDSYHGPLLHDTYNCRGSCMHVCVRINKVNKDHDVYLCLSFGPAQFKLVYVCVGQ